MDNVLDRAKCLYMHASSQKFLLTSDLFMILEIFWTLHENVLLFHCSKMLYFVPIFEFLSLLTQTNNLEGSIQGWIAELFYKMQLIGFQATLSF